MIVARFLVSLIALALLVGSAEAHGRRSASSNATGIAIPSSDHGELIVLSRHYGSILALADSYTASDPTFRKLGNYARIQRYYCLWGLAPFAASDESSPFNECSHAYLSGAKQLLLHMRDMPALAADAGALVSVIEMEMIREGLAFIGCQYSGEVFHTGEFLTPHWELVPGHPPTLLAVALPVAALGAAGLARSRSSRRKAA